MISLLYRLLPLVVVLALSACGGGGGGGHKKSNAYPTASFTLSQAPVGTPSVVSVDASASTDRDGSIASYAWNFGDCGSGSGVTASHTYTIAGTYTVTLTVTDNKGAKSNSTKQVTVAAGAPPATVVVNGRITFDRVPFRPCSTSDCPDGASNDGLDFSRLSVQQVPARQVTVEVVQACTNATLATSATDADGNYVIDAPKDTRVFVRAKAESVSTGSVAQPATWDIAVLDNYGTTSTDYHDYPVYAVDGSAFDTTAAQTRNLNAASGWTEFAGYSEPRAAAPFAILDTLYSAVQFVVGQADDSVALGRLNVFWSTHNQPASPWQPSLGQIITTAYQTSVAPAGIYVLGAADVDTDEFDQHVIAHEFEHFLEDQVSRTDSIGGAHSLGERLDMRVAFGEGFADAFSGMVTNDPVYKDSFGPDQLQVSRYDMERGALPDTVLRGWYDEASIMSAVWDLYDATNGAQDSGAGTAADSVTIGYGPMYDVLTTSLRDGVPLTSIFSFVTALKALTPAQVTGINARIQAEDIVATTMTAYAATETNSGMNGTTEDPTLVLPIYTDVAVNGASKQVCTDQVVGTYNKIGDRRFLKFHLAASGTVRIEARCASGADCPGSPTPNPDLVLYHGLWSDVSRSVVPNVEQYDSPTLEAGDYVLEVYDYSHVNPTATVRRGRTCMTVTITG